MESGKWLHMEVTPGSGSIQTKDDFGDFQLHLEFATPHQVEGDSQGRGNSGVIIYGKYEVQVLDSFDNRTYADGQAGAMYGHLPPLANASKVPGAWQSYDIIFEAPRWVDGKIAKKACVTVIHNGTFAPQTGISRPYSAPRCWQLRAASRTQRAHPAPRPQQPDAISKHMDSPLGSIRSEIDSTPYTRDANRPALAGLLLFGD